MRYFNVYINQYINKLPKGLVDYLAYKHASQNPYKLRNHLDKIHRIYSIGVEECLKYKKEINNKKGDTQFYTSKI